MIFILLFILTFVGTNEKAIHQNIHIKEKAGSRIYIYMINNEQILMCIYKGMIIIRNRWKSFNTIIGDKNLMIQMGIYLNRKKKTKVDCHLFLFTRSKHKNYRLFDLLENNHSCETWIYCFHDNKTSCKTRQEHISYQFTSDRSFFLLRLRDFVFSLVTMLLL